MVAEESLLSSIIQKRTKNIVVQESFNSNTRGRFAIGIESPNSFELKTSTV
jgi:hypothetical protein